MGEVVVGLDAPARKRIADLRAAGTFFWLDVPRATAAEADLGDSLGIPARARTALLEPPHEGAASRRLHVDGERVVFTFDWFPQPAPTTDAIEQALDVVEVRLLVCGDFLLTVHDAPVALPSRLDVEFAEGRSEQYVVYAVLDAMLASAFDALDGVEADLAGLTALASNLRATRVRLRTLRSMTARLGSIRRASAPQRGVFERIATEIVEIRGLGADSERYFERIGVQLTRLTEGVDAAADAMAQLIDLRLNETIYWLTVVATIFLPLTFVTGFFGMNFGWMEDQIRSPEAFVALGIGAPVLGALAVAAWIRRRGTPVQDDRSSS